MKKFSPSHLRGFAGLGLVAALGVSAFAMAQPAPTPSDVPAARLVEDRVALREEHRAMRAEQRAARIAGREARVEARLTFIRTRLGITDAQAPLWDALAESLRNNRLEQFEARSERRDPDSGPPSAVERLAREQERLAARADQLAATANALGPLYDALDTEQKEIADRLLRRFERDRFAMAGERGRRGGADRGRWGGHRGWRHRRQGGGMRRDLENEQEFEQPPQQL